MSATAQASLAEAHIARPNGIREGAPRGKSSVFQSSPKCGDPLTRQIPTCRTGIRSRLLLIFWSSTSAARERSPFLGQLTLMTLVSSWPERPYLAKRGSALTVTSKAAGQRPQLEVDIRMFWFSLRKMSRAWNRDHGLWILTEQHYIRSITMGISSNEHYWPSAMHCDFPRPLLP